MPARAPRVRAPRTFAKPRHSDTVRGRAPRRLPLEHPRPFRALSHTTSRTSPDAGGQYEPHSLLAFRRRLARVLAGLLEISTHLLRDRSSALGSGNTSSAAFER